MKPHEWSYEIHIPIYEEFCIAFWCLHIFGDFYVFLFQTITLLHDVCFVRTMKEWHHSIILRAYVTYFIYYKREMVRCWTYRLLTVILLELLLWYERETFLLNLWLLYSYTLALQVNDSCWGNLVPVMINNSMLNSLY